MFAGDLDGAEANLRLASAGPEPWTPGTYMCLGDVARIRGDLAGARAYYERAASGYTLGTHSSAWVLRSLGYVARREGGLDEAEQLFCESLEGYRQGGNRVGVVEVLCGLAGCALDRGDAARAARLAGAVEAQLETAGEVLWYPDRAELDPVIAAARAVLGEAPFAAAWSAGRALTLDEAVAEARDE